MLQTAQWIMVKPDGSETVLAEAVEDANNTLSWSPVPDLVRYPYGKRVKGRTGDAAWAELKTQLLKEEAKAC